MKAHLPAGMLLAAVILIFGGCAEQRAPTTTTTTAYTKKEPSQDSYTREQLERTGQAQPGSALRFADPDITH